MTTERKVFNNSRLNVDIKYIKAFFVNDIVGGKE